jgi:hypothetical protein
MAQRKQPPVVAELGRPETPEEAAARRAANSRRHRANQTLFNLVIALVASLAIVLFLVVVVVRPDPAPTDPVDYQQIAEQAQASAADPLIAPALPPEWTANAARFGTVNQVPTWYVGFITPSTQFIALNQGLDANPTWVSAVLKDARKTGSTTVEGIEWTVYDQRDADSPGNFAYSMSAVVGGSTVLLHGTAPTAEFELLAASIAAELEES